jgi:hypothetical protein
MPDKTASALSSNLGSNGSMRKAVLQFLRFFETLLRP